MHVQPRDIVATLDLEDGNDDAMDDKLEAEEPAAEVTCGDANETGTQPLGCATVGRCTLLRVHAALSGAAVERRALVRPCAAPGGVTVRRRVLVRWGGTGGWWTGANALQSFAGKGRSVKGVVIVRWSAGGVSD